MRTHPGESVPPPRCRPTVLCPRNFGGLVVVDAGQSHDGAVQSNWVEFLVSGALAGAAWVVAESIPAKRPGAAGRA